MEPLLCFHFHPWKFHPWPQGEINHGEGGVLPAPFITHNCGSYAAEQLGLLLDRLRERGGVLVQAQIATEEI